MGNNSIRGAKDKVFLCILIERNVKIKANCVVVENIPDDSVVVLPKSGVIIQAW